MKNIINTFNDYLFYYTPIFYWIYQYGNTFKFSGMDYYRYFNFKLTIYRPSKTKLPAILLKIVVFGVGLCFLTHKINITIKNNLSIHE